MYVAVIHLHVECLSDAKYMYYVSERYYMYVQCTVHVHAHVAHFSVEGSGNGTCDTCLAHPRRSSETQDLALGRVVELIHSYELLQ